MFCVLFFLRVEVISFLSYIEIREKEERKGFWEGNLCIGWFFFEKCLISGNVSNSVGEIYLEKIFEKDVLIF